MQYVHQSVITSEQDTEVHLAHITFTLLQDKTINIQKIQIHPVINDKIGNNMLLKSKDNPYEILDKSLALDILTQDNIMDEKTFKYKL
jgi:hypothetical protein